MNDLSTLPIQYGHHPLGNMLHFSQRFSMQSSPPHCNAVVSNCPILNGRKAKRLKLDPHYAITCSDTTEAMDGEFYSRQHVDFDDDLNKFETSRNENLLGKRYHDTAVSDSENNLDVQTGRDSPIIEVETIPNETTGLDHMAEAVFSVTYHQNMDKCGGSYSTFNTLPTLSKTTSSPFSSLSSPSSSSSSTPPVTSLPSSTDHPIFIKSELTNNTSNNTSNDTPTENHIKTHHSKPNSSHESNVKREENNNTPITHPFKIDTDTPPDSPSSSCNSPHTSGDHCSHSPLNLSGSYLGSLSSPARSSQNHGQISSGTQQTNSVDVEVTQDEKFDSCSNDLLVTPQNTDSNKTTRKTNFSIDAILSSKFGVDSNSDNNKTTDGSFNDTNSKKCDRVEKLFRSPHSAFTAVDLSLKSRPILSSLSPSAPPPPTTPPSAPPPPTTPPSPPLSSPSSSTSSFHASRCRTPEYTNKFFNEDDDPVSVLNTCFNENYEPIKPPPAYNMNLRQGVKTHLNLPVHPQFLNPFSVLPGSPLIKNPSFLVHRNFPMLYNAYGQQQIGKFPLVYNSPIHNVHTAPQSEIPNPSNHIKTDFSGRHIPPNMLFFHAQGAPVLNQRRKSNLKPSPSLPHLNHDSSPKTDTTLFGDIPPPETYSSYTLDIQEKLNSILDMSPVKNNIQNSNKHNSNFHSKKESKLSDKNRKNLLEKSCKPQVKSPHFQDEAIKNTSDVTEQSETPKQKPTKGDNTTDTVGNPLLPAWVYCTRYSDRPSSGPRSRKSRRKQEQEEKRPRTAFTNDQLMKLKREFDDNRYLTETRRQNLANELGLSESQIKIWFQNKRAKIKKTVGAKNPLAIQLMKQGLYNHATVKTDLTEDNA